MINAMKDKEMSQDEKEEITIIIPAYNEETTISDVITFTNKVMKEKYDDQYSIIVIDDASTDNTYAYTKELERKIPQLTIVKNPKNYGKNKSLLHTLQKIDGGIICFIDGDNQYYPDDLTFFIEKVKNGASIVCGNRTKRADSFYRKVMSFFFNLFNKIMFSIQVHDINCGMKAFRYEEFMLCQPIYNSARWFFDTELLARAYHLNIRVNEVDVKHRDREEGISKVNCFALAFETFYYAILLKVDLFFGRKRNIRSN